MSLFWRWVGCREPRESPCRWAVKLRVLVGRIHKWSAAAESPPILMVGGTAPPAISVARCGTDPRCSPFRYPHCDHKIRPGEASGVINPGIPRSAKLRQSKPIPSTCTSLPSFPLRRMPHVSLPSTGTAWNSKTSDRPSHGAGIGSEEVKWEEVLEDSFNITGESRIRHSPRIGQVDLSDNPSL